MKGKASIKLDVQTGELMIIFLVYLILFSRVVGQMKVVSSTKVHLIREMVPLSVWLGIVSIVSQLGLLVVLS